MKTKCFLLLHGYGTVDGEREASIGEIYKYGEDYFVDVTLNGVVYLAMYACQPALGFAAPHSLAENETQYKIITLKWNQDIKKWKSVTSLSINFDVVCK